MGTRSVSISECQCQMVVRWAYARTILATPSSALLYLYMPTSVRPPDVSLSLDLGHRGSAAAVTYESGDS